MKKMIKLLGVGFLVVNTIAFVVSDVYAEDEKSSEEINQKVEDKTEEQLKLWDVIYDEKNMGISGKTAPYATITSKSLDNPELAAGVFQADATGSFSIVNPPSGVNRVTASLDDKVSDSVDIDVTKSKGEPSLAIKEVVFDQKTNTLTGKTAPNASVGMYVPSTMGQGIVKADENGVFTVVDQLSPGLVIILTATDSQGKTGEPYSFTAPDAQALDSLKILEVDYNHESKTLSGKTAPNVKVVIDYLGGAGNSMIDSDANGYFSYVVELSPGKQIVLSANDGNGNWGEKYTFTVPEVSTTGTKESESMTTDQTNTDKPKEKVKGGLPSTGASQNTILPIFGVFFLLVSIIGYKKKVTISRK